MLRWEEIMARRLAGHGLQLLGYTLTFAGLGVAGTALLLAGNYPTVSLWVFVAVGVAVGAPLMVAGGRVDARGRGYVLGQSHEQAAAHHRRTTILMALHLGMGLLLTAFVIAPLLLRATDWAHPSDDLIRYWIIGWMLTLCATRYWTTRPLWRAIERRVSERWPVLVGSEHSSYVARPRQVRGRAAPTLRKG
jgi:hypothetical protein